MNSKAQRNIFSQKGIPVLSDVCAPPKSNYLKTKKKPGEKMSLCALKGSLTVESALLIPFCMMILLTLFSFFSYYASAATLKVKAAADAKKMGTVTGIQNDEGNEEITAYQTEWLKLGIYREYRLTQKAICRKWIGFTDLETEEAYVYITPGGSVFHLFLECTHLELSIQSVGLAGVEQRKNQGGAYYRPCRVCGNVFGILVYITSEGDCYHSDRNCSGLKRTIRQVPMSEVMDRRCCLRCESRGEEQ